MKKKANVSNGRKDKSILKAVGSVLWAIIASSHHWLHTLLIAFGLTTLGTGLLALPGPVRILFLLASLVISVRFLFVARRTWHHERATAWVYLISSIISIVLVVAVVPQTVGPMFNQATQPGVQHNHNDMQ
ncbi:hypothetical protein CEB3_c28400 [Peptococcaceae bacterium CEB3]|nr:hypothetical protein CEB3_c28400 [Peptococcaceae bacterium CEB3]